MATTAKKGIKMKAKRIVSYQNGNYKVIFDLTTGTKVRSTEDDSFVAAYPESMDIKICDKCNMGCLQCHENSTPDGLCGDILSESFIDHLNPYTELAIGGGNPLEHPDLIPFLKKCKKLKLIPSMTVNQLHFMNNIDLLKELVHKKLIYGLGISLVTVTDEFVDAVKQFPNAVIHVINGIVHPIQLAQLAYNDLKILILGYKEFRRGKDMYAHQKDSIDELKTMLRVVLPDILDNQWFSVVSFDNLALTQLNVKSLMSEEKWEEFYMGDDGAATMYVDMVKREFAKSSTSTERYPLEDRIETMFEKIKIV